MSLHGSGTRPQDVTGTPATPEANGIDQLPADLQDERLIATSGISGAVSAFTARLRSGDLGSVPVVVGLIIIWAVFQIANGSKELLDEVATGKVTGEEEIWSHTDLWDFQANVDGALVGFNVLREIAEARDPELVRTLDERFDALNALLATHGSLEAGFKHYDELSQDEIQALAAAVDALSEPLSKLTSTITGAG